jgi:carboxypeptidase family protein
MEFLGSSERVPSLKRPVILTALVVLTLLAGSNRAWGQAATSLRGAVTDPSGGAVPGATVVLADTASKTARTATTGEQGEYQFLFLPPGTYTLTITAGGFQRYEQTGLQLLVNTPSTANVQLKIGQSTEQVTVTGAAPALNMVDASLGNSFDRTQVTQIPLEGRNVPDLLSLQAGVAYTGNRTDIDKDQDTRSGAVNGARSDQSNITLDGVDVNDQSNGYAFTSVLPVTLDSVQEFRVTTTNYNADQGGGSGAEVALVTKSGTNALHGSAYEYLRNTATSANDYFIKQAELNSGQPNQPLKLIRNIFGASLGGPIQKDRLFLFANYEGTREREEQSVVRNIPTPTLCQGILRYQDVNGGVTTLTPANIKALDPLHIGINPAILNSSHTGFFDKTYCTGQYPTNDSSVGDGLNYSGFRFRAPVSLDNNAFIARMDYHLTTNGKHTLFWRGALQNLKNPQAPFLPGNAPVQTLADHSKGFVVGYTAVLSPSTVNTFHWGFTRQSTGIIGNSTQPWNQFYSLDEGFAYSHNLQMPVHNFLDDFSWIKGSHTLQFGANTGFARDPRVSYLHSFSRGNGNTNWMAPTSFANSGGTSPLDPSFGGYPEPISTPAYDYPMLGLTGMVSDVIANYNYDKAGNLLPAGAPVKRNYGLDWYEFYGQDSWRIKPNLTVTYGLRWSLFPPPWEVNGFQAAQSFSLGKQLQQNIQNMKQGIGYSAEAPLSFTLGGPANHGPGLYHFDKSNFSPRVSLAYSPRPHGGWLNKVFGEGDKTVIRGGFGKVYDRAGLQLINTFDQNAPAGLSATVQNPCCTPTDANGNPYDTADGVPRITNINTIPTVNQYGATFFTPAPPGAFPQTPPAFGEAITWGVDDTLKTPYAYTVDFSIGRELPKRFSLQLSYVGRFGRNLLTQRDLMQPLNLVDPKSGIDYYKAAGRLSELARAGYTPNQITDTLVGPTAAFWKDMIYQSGAFGSTTNLMQAIYSAYGIASYPGNEIVGLANIDLYGYLADAGGTSHYFCATPACSSGYAGDLLNNQMTASYGWSSIGSSNYNGLQVSLRKQFAEGAQFDLNYTFSKSIDISSSATRLGYSSSFNVGPNGARLVNAFSPNDARAVSDFDTRHQINVNWIVELPFGPGKRFARSASPVAGAFIGGWQLSGLARWTTGFPFSVDNTSYWPTDWDFEGLAQISARPKTGAFKQGDGTVSMFANPAAAINDFYHPFPGQGNGSRNVLRGDGYAGWDMALSKRWKMPFEGHILQFRWEVFNVPNLVRFNVQSVGVNLSPSLIQVPGGFGDYTGLLSQPRVMQFALRYEF